MVVVQWLRPSIQMEQIGRLVDMSPKEIVAADVQKNHKGTPLELHLKSLGHHIADGNQIVRQNNTLFLYETKARGVVEFHTYNADDGKQLAENTKKFFRMLNKVGAKQVFTTYKNPKISELFKLLEPEFKAIITKDSQFTAKVNLQ